MSTASEMEAMRLDVLTGRDLQKSAAEQCVLIPCAHCSAPAEILFVLQRPYGACTNTVECGATTGAAEDIPAAAAKWNRRDG